MGCVVSKKLDEREGEVEEEDVVLVCRERKRLMKMALESRSALSDSQCKYNYSLFTLSAALRLFVSRYSSPSSPFLITFDPPPSEQEQIKQGPEQKQEEEVDNDNESKSEEEEEKKEEEISEGEEKEGCECKHFYDHDDDEYEMGFSPMPRKVEFQWDFFTPFDGFSGNEGFDHEDLRVVREQEGIPDLEEDGDRFAASEEKGENVNISNVTGQSGNSVDDVKNKGGGEGGREQKSCLKVVDTANDRRELLEALKDVVDLFMRGYDSGLEVSRMLETNMAQVQCTLEEIKENSNKLIQSIPRSRSSSTTLSWSSSCKSLLHSSSKSSSGWTESQSDVFDGYGGMESGSHSLTLGRLYAWEKKLYEEVKSAEETRRAYDQKCSQLRNQEAKRDGQICGDKTAAEVKHLYTRIMVAIRSAESISEQIQKLRDHELQPQLIELLHGLMRNWKVMLEMHETQNKIMYQVKFFDSPAYGKFCNDSHRLATLQLEAELRNWHACFAAYVSSQKAYIEALSGWLSKFVIASQTELCSNGRINMPPLLAMCHDWFVCLDNLPDKAVIYAMKSFRKDIHALLVKQGEEQQQKRKVDGLAKELDRKVVAFERAEKRVLESKISGQEGEIHVRNRIEYLVNKKEQLEVFRKKVDMEKVKHQNSMQETQLMAVSGFQTGFSSLFASLADFSRAAVKMYGDQLVTFSENSVANEKIKLENLDFKAMKA